MKRAQVIMIVFCMMVGFVYAQQPGGSDGPLNQRMEIKKESTITYKIIASANDTWGYDIYSDDKLKVHQPTIPGYPGNEGLKTKEAATRVAEFVSDKIRKGINPPTISKEELKNLNVL